MKKNSLSKVEENERVQKKAEQALLNGLVIEVKEARVC